VRKAEAGSPTRGLRAVKMRVNFRKLVGPVALVYGNCRPVRRITLNFAFRSRLQRTVWVRRANFVPVFVGADGEGAIRTRPGRQRYFCAGAWASCRRGRSESTLTPMVPPENPSI